MANTATAARKPAAAKAAKPAPADKLAAALKGVSLPAANNSMAWLGLLAELPALAEIVAASRAGKYGQGKGLVGGAADMLQLTGYGVQVGQRGYVKKPGAPNAQAATCAAAMAACAALQTDTVCKAAIVFFMLTDSNVLAALRGCKAVQYVGRTGTPCPAWAAGYINGNVRADMFKRQAA